MVIEDDRKASEKGVSLQRRQRSSSAQPGAQPGELKTLTEVASQPTTPTTSCPSTPAASSPPASVASPSPATDAQEEGASPPSPLTTGIWSTITHPLLQILEEGGVPMELANYLKLLASEKDKKKIHSLSGDCMLNNAMHNATADQLLAERNQLVARLPVLEAKATEAAELEARLQQSK
ncbi:PREDICTED: uncharacterized protein LOC109234003 [Nicotiana attenuata]|uniref:uncharacterized protein LOC109234003 n=1 Tax=Nicotiana attenuata TaxID=49451 RepID=UPI000905C7B9|nr:PREDICTED: uncharacterized protein LOC109234003 [Nicotiana attenuata]